MGLDMYLAAKKSISRIDYEKLDRDNGLGLDSPEVINEQFTTLVKNAGLENVATDHYGVEVGVTCAYWRKCNQVHGWFVNNVQRGEDDCGEYYVSTNKLQELLDTVNTALKTRDPNLLPPTQGFFFGGYDIDEYYWNDLKYTKAQLERVLGLPELSELSFYYSSSW